jgi:hypothetical protein
VQLIYKARLLSPEVAAGEETAEVGLFPWGAMPWDDLAFPSVRWALGHYREVAALPVFAPRRNPEGEIGDY